MRFTNSPYGSFILGFLCAAMLTTSSGLSFLRAGDSTDGIDTGDRPLSIGFVDDRPIEPVPVAAMQAARLWADLLTDGWEHIIDPIGFDEMTAEYCVLRRHAVNDNAGPYGELAAAERVNDWARQALGYEHRNGNERQTVAALVVSMGYGCTSAI